MKRLARIMMILGAILLIGGFIWILRGSAHAADIKPTFTLEQAQIILNMSNAEMERACQKGNCIAAKPALAIAEEIIRAAQEAQRPAIPAAPMVLPEPPK